ncbi:valine--trna ligase [Gossypium arboreum]|uniref:Valine--trna ligase n=1 Tax=Gossypium arboreum TaxID=29729 RepID=A0A0B0MMZ7_GOSAR|nr:valine--trna ligase [Gossypium arboreum]
MSMNSRIFFRFLVWWIFFSFFSGLISSAVVRLDSIEIYNTHDWITKPTVYFVCKGENMTVLPDVTKANTVYTFKGEESWQPLTELESKKCKRCGFYEEDTFKSDDVFDEWEFCASDFKANGKYILFKEKELNVTFTCEECASLPAGTFNTDTNNDNKGNKLRVGIIVLIVLVALTVTIFGLMMAYKYWQKRKRQQDQARFLKLFEEGDDLEDELELGN